VREKLNNVFLFVIANTFHALILVLNVKNVKNVEILGNLLLTVTSLGCCIVKIVDCTPLTQKYSIRASL